MARCILSFQNPMYMICTEAATCIYFLNAGDPRKMKSAEGRTKQKAYLFSPTARTLSEIQESNNAGGGNYVCKNTSEEYFACK